MIYTDIKIGSDPELFIVNNETNTVVSSIGLIPGKKKAAYRPAGMPEGYGIQTDNILAEFNIPPTNNIEDFVHHINYMKRYIRDFVKEKNKNYDIRCVASQHVPWDQLLCEEACEFGCDPDYNAYTEDVNPKPKGDKTDLRSAGVHIHVSYKNPNIPASVRLVKYLDLYLGVPSVIIDPDTERRKLYGKAGAFRIVRYGVEYRSMSGYFISSDDHIRFLFRNTMRAIKAANAMVPLPNEDLVQSIINDGNEKEAKKLITSYGLI